MCVCVSGYLEQREIWTHVGHQVIPWHYNEALGKHRLDACGQILRRVQNNVVGCQLVLERVCSVRERSEEVNEVLFALVRRDHHRDQVELSLLVDKAEHDERKRVSYYLVRAVDVKRDRLVGQVGQELLGRDADMKAVGVRAVAQLWTRTRTPPRLTNAHTRFVINVNDLD